MKKFLLSLVAILATITVNAKEVVTETAVFEFASGWSWQNVKGFSTGALITDETKKTVDDSNIVYSDMSAYDYLVIEYLESTTEVNVILQYNTTGVLGQWGAEFYQGNATISKSPKAGVIGIKLDPDHKKTVNTLAFQNTNATGSLSIKSIFFGSEAEYQEALNAGTIKYEEPKTLEWADNQIRSAQFDGYSMDAQVEFTYTATGDVSKYPGWGMAAITSLDGSVKVGDIPAPNEGENKKTYYLSELVEALNAPCVWPGITTSGLQFNMYGQQGVTVVMNSVKIYEQVGTTSEKYTSKPDVVEGATDKAPIYVIGNINGSTEWLTNTAAAELAYDSATSTYTGSITVDNNWEGYGWFTIIEKLTETAGDWDTFNANRLSVSKDWGTLNEAGTLAKNGDVSFKLAVGTYTITVDLANMTILITADAATAIQSVATSAKSGKFVENGNIVIYNNGKKFNVAGAAIK